MQIDKNKWYEGILKDVQSLWWKPFAKQALRVYVEVPELRTVIPCTFGIPRTLRPGKNKFSKILGVILNEQYPDELLRNPKALADLLAKDLAEKPCMASLSPSSNDEHPVNIEALMRHGGS